MYEARIERDSITQYGERLTTFVVTAPRIVLAEFNTHKMISKSSASSRAIPVEKQIARLREDPFYPVHWGKNQKGMQAEVELTDEEATEGRNVWRDAATSAVGFAKNLLELGVHKQITNRLLEPFMWHTLILTGTEWSNFFHLRDNSKAQPEFQKSAGMMNELFRASRPKLLRDGEWHLPFDQGEDTAWSIQERVQISVGRCARVSYLTHDGQRDAQADLILARSLLSNGHMAPWEHVSRPMSASERHLFHKTNWVAAPATERFIEPQWIAQGDHRFLGNLNGWVQARKLIHGEHDILAFER